MLVLKKFINFKKPQIKSQHNNSLKFNIIETKFVNNLIEIQYTVLHWRMKPNLENSLVFNYLCKGPFDH